MLLLGAGGKTLYEGVQIQGLFVQISERVLRPGEVEMKVLLGQIFDTHGDEPFVPSPDFPEEDLKSFDRRYLAAHDDGTFQITLAGEKWAGAMGQYLASA